MSELPAYQEKFIVPIKDRALEQVYLGIGSNIGKREEHISKAIKLITDHPNFELIKQSKVIETKPHGKTKQPKFLNTVIEIKTKLPAITLLQKLEAIEKNVGKKSSEKWGPREIDIDILFYGSHMIVEENLTIPHPLLTERDFVLKPLHEIAPKFIHPILGESISQLLKSLNAKEVKQKS